MQITLICLVNLVFTREGFRRVVGFIEPQA
jgi:hypothetical protein